MKVALLEIPAQTDPLDAMQAKLGLCLKNHKRLRQALRHRSAVSERPGESNERMEFLGDSIVGMAVCDALYRRFPDSCEGDLAKAKAFIVSEPVLAAAAGRLGIDDAIEMTVSEAASGGRGRSSILADAFEAVVAAVYLDRGFQAAFALVHTALDEALQRAAVDAGSHDFKSRLQEVTQAIFRETPTYRIVAESGLHHDRTFVAEALLGDEIVGEGTGKTKKHAQQEAARIALAHLAAEPPKTRSKGKKANG